MLNDTVGAPENGPDTPGPGCSVDSSVGWAAEARSSSCKATYAWGFPAPSEVTPLGFQKLDSFSLLETSWSPTRREMGNKPQGEEHPLLGAPERRRGHQSRWLQIWAAVQQQRAGVMRSGVLAAAPPPEPRPQPGLKSVATRQTGPQPWPWSPSQHRGPPRPSSDLGGLVQERRGPAVPCDPGLPPWAQGDGWGHSVLNPSNQDLRRATRIPC